jgi:Polysaccharide deacetylase
MKRMLAVHLLDALSNADDGTLAALLRAGLGDRALALCFHRVAFGPRRGGELVPKLTMPAAEIDRLIGFVASEMGRPGRRLTVCFDDGYREAAEYVLSRAPLRPDVEWLFFVCPAKVEGQVGFRWDLAELLRRADPAIDDASIVHAPLDLAAENLRGELRDLASDERFALADVEICRRLQRLPNVVLGNHSNVHHRASALTREEFRAEYERSTADFRRLFGEPRHAAFPFGVPGTDFDAAHVEALRQIGAFEIWSTEPRPYRLVERGAGAVLPRFAVDGTRGWKESVAHVVLHCFRTRLRRGEARAVPSAGART